MARFIEKVKEFATGKNAEEREYESKINKEIRAEAMRAELEERRVQNVRLAKERIKIQADAKLRSFRQKAIQQPQQGFGMFNGYGSPFGQPRQLGTRTVRQVRVPMRKGKRKSKVRYVYNKPVNPVANRFDVVGGFGTNRKSGYRVI